MSHYSCLLTCFFSGCKHVFCKQPFLILPVPPQLILSLQYLHTPQFCFKQFWNKKIAEELKTFMVTFHDLHFIFMLNPLRIFTNRPHRSMAHATGKKILELPLATIDAFAWFGDYWQQDKCQRSQYLNFCSNRQVYNRKCESNFTIFSSFGESEPEIFLLFWKHNDT